MAQGEIRIGIAGAGASDFASSPVSVLTLYRGGDEPFTLRSVFGFNAPGDPTIYGSTPITGPQYAPRQLWTLSPWLTRDEANQLYALALWQKANGTALRLIDEVDTITIDTTYNNRTLLSSTTPAWGANYRTGYGIFSVQLTVEGEWSQYLGLWAGTEDEARAVTFTATEV